jgi:hypothetical protein
MLDTTNTTIPTTCHRSIRPLIHVSGQSLAKSRNEPRDLANLAAGWVLGSVTFSPPTIALAVKVFGVSPALIRGAIKVLEERTVAPSPLEAAWAPMRAHEREQFVRDHLDEIWRIVDDVTFPVTICSKAFA